MKRVRYSVLLAVAAGTLACDSTETIVPLTLDQATAVLAAMVVHYAGAEEGTHVKSCPLGGAVRYTHTSDHRESGDTAWWSVDMELYPGGCEVEAGGETLALTGDPSVDLHMERWYASESEEGEFDLTVTGAVTWRRDDNISDRCEVDLDLAVALGAHTNEDDLGDLTGLLCGHDAEIPFPQIVIAGG